MKKFFDNPWVYRVISLALAILLFIYINNTQVGVVNQKNDEQTTQMATKSATVSVTLQVITDNEKYFVTGYPEKVEVKLEGPTALVTSTINTENFRAFIDLSKYKDGTHNIPIEVSGLNSQISYTVNPKRTKVKIQPRKSKSFPVQIVYNKDNVAKGYEISTPKADPSVVKVTGPTSEINQVDHLEAKISVPSGSTETIEREVILQAIDKDGRQLNVVVNPATTHVTVPISLPSKTVDLKYTFANKADDIDVKASSETTQVKIFGKTSDLDKISELEVALDLKDRTKSFDQIVSLKKPDGVVSIDPKSVKVSVELTDK